MILAFETGRQLGTRAIFAEEVASDDGPRREFRRGFEIKPGERVLLVDDILTTGGSLLAMIPAVEALGGEIVECVVLVDRSGGLSTLTSPTTGRVYPLRALWALDLPTFEAGAGLPAVRRRRARRQAREQRHGPGARVTGGRGRARSPSPRWSSSRSPACVPGTPAADPRPPRPAPGSPGALTSPVEGVPDRHRGGGPHQGHGVHGSAPTTAREVRFRDRRRSRTATEFPPAHLAEHLADSTRIGVFFRDEGERRGRLPAGGRPDARGVALAASCR